MWDVAYVLTANAATALGFLLAGHGRFDGVADAAILAAVVSLLLAVLVTRLPAGVGWPLITSGIAAGGVIAVSLLWFPEDIVTARTLSLAASPAALITLVYTLFRGLDFLHTQIDFARLLVVGRSLGLTLIRLVALLLLGKSMTRRLFPSAPR